MKIFIKAKHWQIFLALVLVFIALSSSFFSLRFPFSHGILTTVFMAFVVGWLCTIGVASNNRLRPDIRKSPLLMYCGFAYSLSYSLVFSFGLPFLVSGDKTTIIKFIAPFHILSIAGMFYGLGYTAKRFRSLEIGKNASFSESFYTFIAMWFFPIGIWFIQPKVNGLLDESDT